MINMHIIRKCTWYAINLDHSLFSIFLHAAFCPEQIDSGILWPRTDSNSEVSRACNLAGSLFRQRTFITRYCSEIGIWSDIDFSTCTLVADPPPFLLLSFVLETGEEVNGLDDDSTYLETQMKNLLRDRGILFTDVILQSSYIASISVTFEVTLPFTPTQDEQLVSFSNYFTTSFTMFGNFSVRPGNRTLRQVSASGEQHKSQKLYYCHYNYVNHCTTRCMSMSIIIWSTS